MLAPVAPLRRDQPPTGSLNTNEVNQTVKNHKTRLMAVSGATLALVVGATAAVAAHPGDDRVRRGYGGGFGQLERGMPGDRGALRGGLEGFERREVTVQTADGTTSDRVEQGTVSAATDTSLEFTLGSGETVSVVIDDDTQTIEFSQQTVEGRRGFTRERMVPAEIEISDIASGTEVVVWSDSEDGADYVAQRVVVRPAADATDAAADTSADADASADTGAADASAAPATDA
jgi:hypothetical protein